MAAQTITLSEEQFDALPEDEREHYELLDGELAELPSPTVEHQLLVGKLYSAFVAVFQTPGWGKVLLDVEFGFGDGCRLRPDIALVAEAEFVRVDIRALPVRVVPGLVVEVISPSESLHRVDQKLDLYLAAGVAEIWAVNPNAAHVYRFMAGSTQRLGLSDVIECALLPGWSLPLSDLFRL